MKRLIIYAIAIPVCIALAAVAVIAAEQDTTTDYP